MCCKCRLALNVMVKTIPDWNGRFGDLSVWRVNMQEIMGNDTPENSKAMSQLTDLRRVLFKRFNWQALLSLKTLQGKSLVAGATADNIFDQWNRQNLSPMFGRVKSKTDATVDGSGGIRWPAIGCTTEKNHLQSNCIYAELQTNNLIFRPLLATMTSLLFYVWLCRCHRQVTTSQIFS